MKKMPLGFKLNLTQVLVVSDRGATRPVVLNYILTGFSDARFRVQLDSNSDSRKTQNSDSDSSKIYLEFCV